MGVVFRHYADDGKFVFGSAHMQWKTSMSGFGKDSRRGANKESEKAAVFGRMF